MSKKTTEGSSKLIKNLRKWSRILHRDIGYFFLGASLIYGLSGIALNHLRDWNPNYVVDFKEINIDNTFEKGASKDEIIEWVNVNNFNGKYKTHYYPEPNQAKIYLTNSITVYLNLNNGSAVIETLKKRTIFYHTNYLHYNPGKWWTWFSDAFAGALILFAITALFMVRGKKGAWGRGGIYIILGILIPLLVLFLT
ncbi:MAG: PepSY-associated TM helix domain-containing protein [Bacteroidales bacterium]|nr:PepSY-associated TM helix domain-containing protein [Bacteroidales bacterium]